MMPYREGVACRGAEQVGREMQRPRFSEGFIAGEKLFFVVSPAEYGGGSDLGCDKSPQAVGTVFE